MLELDVFRRDLCSWLSDCAQARRRAFATGAAAVENLRIAALLEDLAADAANLDRHVFLIFELMLTYRALARRFMQQRERLLFEVGVSCSPATATDLLRWLIRQTLDDDALGRHGTDKPRCIIVALRDPDEAVQSRSYDGMAGALFSGSTATKLCRWIGLVAPVVAIWELGHAVGQWRNQAAADARPAVPATVISSEPVGSLRHSSMASDTVVEFQPMPSSMICQTSVRVGSSRQPEPGTTMMVIPRSSHCEPPLLASDIGNATISYASGAFLLLCTLIALKLRRWLDVRRSHGRFRAGSSEVVELE